MQWNKLKYTQGTLQRQQFVLIEKNWSLTKKEENKKES